jgi:hypothetical protein
VAVLFAAQTHAACALNLQKSDVSRGKVWELSWAAVPGATGYTVESIRENEDTDTVTIRKIDVVPRGGATKVTQEVSVLTTVPLTITYRVTAVGAPEACSATIDVTYSTDSTLQRTARKAVIPLVGSTRGANGSLFKTSIHLRGTGGRQRGMLVFHPVNTPGRDTDPAIPYDLAGTADTMEIDDIGPALGTSGLGSLDIIPDFDERTGWTVPSAEVRLFNVAEEGTYGTIEAQIQPYDFLSGVVDPVAPLTFTIPTSQLRVNVAVRTFQKTEVLMEVLRAGTILLVRQIDLEADFLYFATANNAAGVELQPGDVVTLRLPNGGGVPMYTLTDNQTNDPALFMQPTRIRYDVGAIDVGF